ncbi:hypothetical protein F9B85_05300 [Heliorestis acidaminivorans]|uniref:Uncharacterized protein n=1 Tax=Heliorestis acidaminivorans TaxID=553427 RepID=A0A6I0ETD6_9FIRM|nr:hypothetical protein [Heliorestis acidaminivorans]KAB2953329.1 hypothetical protein F9B85_05300 [Heliorestis acidaminivorans]
MNEKDKVVSLDYYKKKQLEKLQQESRNHQANQLDTFEQLLEKAILKEFGPILADSIYKSIIGAYAFSEKAHHILFDREGDDALKIQNLKMCYDDYSNEDEKWED